MATKRGMNERIQKLRDLSVNTPVHIDLERAKIETDFYKENEGKYSIPVMRSMVLKEYFSKKTLYLGDGELIVGEKGKDPQASPTFPELCCHSVEDMTVMSERDLVSFHTTEEDRKLQAEEIIPYWKGKTMREKLLSMMTPEWHDCYVHRIHGTERSWTHMRRRAGVHNRIHGLQRKNQKDYGFPGFHERSGSPG